jgi:heme/copper-type cytochrome/quinol oxidase subunit 2
MSFRNYLASAALAGSLLLSPVVASAADMAPAIHPVIASADGQVDNFVPFLITIIVVISGVVTTITILVTQSP